MNWETRVFTYLNGEIQRICLARPDDWEQLELLKPEPADGALACFHQIYRQYLIPAAPWVFGNLVMFRLPEDMDVPFADFSGKYGEVSEALTAAALALKKGVRIRGGIPKFRNPETEIFWKELERRDCIRIARGKLPITTIIPVGNEAGYLTQTEPEAALKVNGAFFTMDPFDCATLYDHIGRYIGLFVKNGKVENPPLFGREALLVRKDGKVSIEQPDVRQLQVQIGEECFVHGQNAHFYSRPSRDRSPFGGKTLVIMGKKVVAVSYGSTPIPGAGFVICTKDACDVRPGDEVVYKGMEDVAFGIQVGNSIVRDGVKTEKFISRFFNVKGLWRIAFPPSLYPLDFQRARASRIAIGADREGKPMILWAEGAAKIGHVSGSDSCGATLADMAQICHEVGMFNAVNLDGGGSAQLLLNNRRELLLSDRNDDGTERERPVPMGLMVR